MTIASLTAWANTWSRPTTQRRILIAVSVGLAATIVAELAWIGGVTDRWLAGASASSPPVAQAASSDHAADDTTLTIENYASIWSLDWRRPLFDPPPVVVKADPPPPPRPPRVKLLGTVIEPANSFALLRDPSGKSLLARVGDAADEQYRVESIAAGTVVLVGDDGRKEVLTTDTDPRDASDGRRR